MSKHRILTAVVFAFLLGCCGPSQQVSKHMDITMIISKLDECPSWADMNIEDKETVKKLMETLTVLKDCDGDLLRQALVQYVEMKKKSEGHHLNLTCASKLFVLNRYLFNVPDNVTNSVPSFGGWVIPHDDKTANWLWPFVRKDGQLILTGSFHGYYGAGYDAVGEFDFFRRVYGFRV